MFVDRGLAYAELLKRRKEYRQYKKTHWNYEKNHLQLDAIDGLYVIFRAGIIAKQRYLQSLNQLNRK